LASKCTLKILQHIKKNFDLVAIQIKYKKMPDTILKIKTVMLALAISTFTFTQSSAQSNSQQPASLTLKQAVDYAIEHNSKVKDAALDMQISEKKVKEIRGIGLPQINGSAEIDDYVEKPVILFPDVFSPAVYGVLYKEQLIDQQQLQQGLANSGQSQAVSFQPKYNATYGVSASQLLFDGGFFIGLKAASTYVDLSRKSIDASKIEVAANVTKAYYSVLVANKRMGLIDANLSRLEKSYHDLQAMYKNGLVEKLDVDRLEVSLNNLQIEKQKVQNLIDLSTNLLKFQMGMPINQTVAITDSLAENNIAEPKEVAADPTKRIEYSQMQVAMALQSLDIKRNQFSYFPSLAAFGSFSRQAQRNEFNIFNSGEDWFNIGIVGVKMTVPIFDGLQKSARIQQGKLSLMKLNNDLDNLKNAIALETANANVQYENNYKTLQNQRRNLDLAKEVVRVTQIKYEQGVGTNLEVVNAEASLKEAQTNYFGALYDLLISQVDLMKATGTLY
jgi:outer membrane protein TolC